MKTVKMHQALGPDFGGMIYQLRYVESEEAFRRAVLLEPSQYVFRIGLAKALENQRKFDESEAQLKEAVRQNPENIQARVYVGEFYFRSKNVEAERVIEEAIQIANNKPPTDESDLNVLGYFLLNVNRMQDAIKILKLNVAAFPQSANAYDSLGEAYEKQGKLDLAHSNYEKAVALSKQNNNLNLSLYQANLDRVTGLLNKGTDKK